MDFLDDDSISLDQLTHAGAFARDVHNPEYRQTRYLAQERTRPDNLAGNPEQSRPTQGGNLPIYGRSFQAGQENAEDPGTEPTPIIVPNYLTRCHFLRCWRGKTDGEDEFGYTIHDQASGSVQLNEDQGFVTWIHYQEPQKKLNRSQLNVLFKQQAHLTLSTNLGKNVSSLLKRAQSQSDKAFVGGHFWQPGAMRYDSVPHEPDSHASPCMFLNFPYICLEPHQPMARNDHDESTLLCRAYPVRSLLQSYYRLELTNRRETKQCVTTLTTDQLNRCLWPRAIRKPQGYKGKDVLTVQQLWCISTVEDTLVSYSPLNVIEIGCDDLDQFGYIENTKTVVLIIEIDGKSHRYRFFAGYCDSWFGLLHKKSQIMLSLGLFNENGSQKERYNLFLLEDGKTEHELSADNWVPSLQSCRNSKIEVLIKPELSTKAGQSPDANSMTDANSAASNRDNSASGLEDTLSSFPSSTVHLADVMQTPFLHWQRRMARQSSKKEQVIRNQEVLLDSLHSNRQPICLEYGRMKLREGQSIAERYPTGLEELRGLRIDEELNADTWQRGLSKFSQKFLHITKEIIDSFLPGMMGPLADFPGHSHNTDDEHQTTSTSTEAGPSVSTDPASSGTNSNVGGHSSSNTATIVESVCEHALAKMFRHVFESILVLLRRPNVPEDLKHEVLHCFSLVLEDLRIIHRGVRSESRLETQPESEIYHGSAIFQSSLLDAFKHIIFMYLAVRQWLMAIDDQNEPLLVDFVKYQTKHVRKLLLRSLQRIIMVGGHFDEPTNLGPLVTSEAVLIMILDRLGRGVCGRGTVDVLDVYETAVEQLKLKIEFSASRRLLQQMNHLSEELEAVCQVLVQQQKVLSLLKDLLDPATFASSTSSAPIDRKSRFAFESRALDDLMRKQSDRIAECDEIRNRVRILSVQNVQLVETQLDDNNRAVLIFTIVTVVFVPMTFVCGFFGMDFTDFPSQRRTVMHFWDIAAPLTAGIAVPCILVAFWGPLKRLINRLQYLWYAAKLSDQN